MNVLFFDSSQLKQKIKDEMLSNTGEPDDTPDASEEPPAKKVKAEEGSTPPASSKGNKANAADETTSDVDSATVYCEYKTYFIGVAFSFAYCNYVEGTTLHMHRLYQGIIDSTGTETFAKEPKLVKLFQELQSTPVRCNNKHVNGCFFANIELFSIGLHRLLEHI